MNATRGSNPAVAHRLFKSVLHLGIGVMGETRPLLAGFGLTGPQWANLHTLSDAPPEGLRLSEISKRLRVTEGNITGVVDRLVESGLVERLPHAEDRRVIFARLTQNGRELYDKVAPVFLRRLAELFSVLSDSEKEALAETLEELTLQVAAAGEADSNGGPVAPAAKK
jgi:DNA-binding MarR family transcriptional regulator